MLSSTSASDAITAYGNFSLDSSQDIIVIEEVTILAKFSRIALFAYTTIFTSNISTLLKSKKITSCTWCWLTNWKTNALSKYMMSLLVGIRFGQFNDLHWPTLLYFPVLSSTTVAHQKEPAGIPTVASSVQVRYLLPLYWKGNVHFKWSIVWHS